MAIDDLQFAQIVSLLVSVVPVILVEVVEANRLAPLCLVFP